MKKILAYCFLVIALFFNHDGFTQNLIPNGDFELFNLFHYLALVIQSLLINQLQVMRQD